MICKKCGAENNEGLKFCKQCGNPLNEGNAEKTVIPKNNKNGWYKTKRNKIIAGICAGLAEKFNINPWILRIILIVTNFFVIGWFLDIAYVIMIFTLKYDDEL
ncbi:MAG: PspC domain-containing protein [Clostridia bacterium]|nr:PspC domain-containing protein [Clostridia bacterium]